MEKMQKERGIYEIRLQQRLLSDVYSAMMSAMVVIYMVIALVNLVVYVLSIIADYRLFEKAGEEGWKAIIPFYNYFVLCRIVMGDSLWFGWDLSRVSMFSAGFISGSKPEKPMEKRQVLTSA